jgi:hypothetical protein
MYCCPDGDEFCTKNRQNPLIKRVYYQKEALKFKNPTVDAVGGYTCKARN